MQGASIELTQRIFADIGVPTVVTFQGPFSRVLAAAKAGKVDVVTTLKDTPERRNYLLFSEVMFNNPVAIFVRKDHVVNYSVWSDLIPYHGGIARGNRFGEPFDTYLLQHLNIEESNSLETSFKMLGKNRFDYVITGYFPGMAYLSSSPDGENFMALSPYVSLTPNMVGFVKSSPCRQYLDAFNRRLRALTKEKAPDHAIERATELWLKKPHFTQ